MSLTRDTGPGTGGGESTGVWRAAAVLAAIALLAYAFWMPRLGLYWDDWWLVWARETGGASSLLEGLVGERLLHGWMYVLTTAVYDVSPVALHLLVLATRWAAALAAWWTVRALWPERGVEALAVGALVVVYPGFSQQSLALIYSDYFLTLAFFLVSLAGMLWALRGPRPAWGLLGASILAAIPAHWVIEYWLGLELLRLPLAYWVARSGAGRGAWKRAAAYTAPFYLNVAVKVGAAMMAESTARSAETLGGYLATIAASPVKELTHRAGYVVSDLANALVFAWTRALQPELLELRLRYALGGAFLMVGAAAVTYVGLRAAARDAGGGGEDGADTPPAGPGRESWAWMAMALGVGAVLVGQLPLWITDRHIEWQVAALDRHSLPAMFGGVVFLVGLAGLLLKRRGGFALGLALVVAVGVGYQFRQGHAYWLEHEQQADFMWQWHWRAPGMAPGTSLFLHHEPVSIPQPKDYTYAVPLNLSYDPGYDGGPVDYWAFPDASGFPPYWLMLLSGGDPGLIREVQGLVLAGSGTGRVAELERRVRNLTFEGTVDSAIVVLHRPPGCVRVMDPERDEVVDLPPAVLEARLHSRPDLIRPDGERDLEVLERLYGPEPEHGWCYHYQKAELARQRGDWGAVASLADRVREAGLAPADDREWTTFIEGYVRAGRDRDAADLVGEVVPYRGSIWNLHDRYARNRAFCDLRGRLGADGLLERSKAVFGSDSGAVLDCDTPIPVERSAR